MIMALLLLFSVRDAKTGAWMPPMTFRTRGECMRSFADEVNRGPEQSMLRQHPEDFEMFEIGTFDSDSGEIGVVPAVSLTKAVNLQVVA